MIYTLKTLLKLEKIMQTSYKSCTFYAQYRRISNSTAIIDKKKKLFGVNVAKIPATATDWYKKAVLRGGLVDYSELSGYFVYKPNAIFIWNKIKGALHL